MFIMATFSSSDQKFEKVTKERLKSWIISQNKSEQHIELLFAKIKCALQQYIQEFSKKKKKKNICRLCKFFVKLFSSSVLVSFLLDLFIYLFIFLPSCNKIHLFFVAFLQYNSFYFLSFLGAGGSFSTVSFFLYFAFLQ